MTSFLNIDEPTVISKFESFYKGFDASLARKLVELIQHAYTSSIIRNLGN